MKRIIVSLFMFLSACGDFQTQESPDLLNKSWDLAEPPFVGEEGHGQGGSGSLPIGFFERGCQWDRPCDWFKGFDPKSNPGTE